MIKCDNCTKLKEKVINYSWIFERHSGVANFCEECADELKRVGYQLDDLEEAQK